MQKTKKEKEHEKGSSICIGTRNVPLPRRLRRLRQQLDPGGQHGRRGQPVSYTHLTQNEFRFVESFMPFTAFDETGIVGFFTLRNPNESLDELRFGFVIVNPEKRGKSYGKAMLRLGLKFVFEIYGAKRATLGVFENNLPAYYCYKAVGFDDVILDTTETYCILGEEWKCKELMVENV